VASGAGTPSVEGGFEFGFEEGVGAEGGKR